MAEELITSDCFKDMTIEGQLYEILVAIDQIDPNGGVPAIHAPSIVGTLLAQANS